MKCYYLLLAAEKTTEDIIYYIYVVNNYNKYKNIEKRRRLAVDADPNV